MSRGHAGHFRLLGFNPRPRAGGDLRGSSCTPALSPFQSAPPRGGRPGGLLTITVPWRFQGVRVPERPAGSEPCLQSGNHSGLSGRKNAVDAYGESSRHSQKALSGKEPLRINRPGVWATRHAAKNVVAAGLARECEVPLSYSNRPSRPAEPPGGDFRNRHAAGRPHRPTTSKTCRFPIRRNFEAIRTATPSQPLPQRLLPRTRGLWTSGPHRLGRPLGGDRQGHPPGKRGWHADQPKNSPILDSNSAQGMKAGFFWIVIWTERSLAQYRPWTPKTEKLPRFRSPEKQPPFSWTMIFSARSRKAFTLPLSSSSKDRRGFGFAMPCIDSRSVFMSRSLQCDALSPLVEAILVTPVWQAHEFRITFSCHKDDKPPFTAVSPFQCMPSGGEPPETVADTREREQPGTFPPLQGRGPVPAEPFQHHVSACRKGWPASRESR